jgi:hypothetical protein
MVEGVRKEAIMRMWTGADVFQWEHSRKWDLNSTSEFCRADGALILPGGFRSLSIFFRRVSQSAGTFEIFLYTAPLYFKLLDDEMTSNNAIQLLYKLSLKPSTGLQMTGTGAQVFAAQIDPDQPMGSLLFWEIKNTIAAGTLVGDLYIVPNHSGMMTMPRISRTLEVGDIRPLGPSSAGHVARMK